MVDEEDQHRHVDDDQAEGDGDRDVRDEITVVAATDGHQGDYAVDERRHESPQSELGAGVANEIAQHARTELSRGQRQRDDSDREDDADDGDDGCGDRGQDLSCGVRTSADHPARRAEVAVIRGSIQAQGHDEEGYRTYHQNGRNDPQVGAQLLAAPLRDAGRRINSHGRYPTPIQR